MMLKPGRSSSKEDPACSIHDQSILRVPFPFSEKGLDETEAAIGIKK